MGTRIKASIFFLLPELFHRHQIIDRSLSCDQEDVQLSFECVLTSFASKVLFDGFAAGCAAGLSPAV
jgi:hypothetical protein